MEGSDDWLSHLPENLIHHIMSFLSRAETARLSTFSKRLSYARLSFPHFDFQFHYTNPLTKPKFHEYHSDEDHFLEFVHNFLERHRNLETNFETLSLKTRKSHNWIDIALENTNIFRISKMHRGLKSVEVTSSAELIRTISIHYCSGLERNHVDKKASFELFFRATNTYEIVDIDLACRKSLKVLKLERVKITDDWFRNNVSEFEFLETLKLFACQELKNVRIRNENLKCLELESCNALKNIDVMISGLESFSCCSYRNTTEIININISRFLQVP
ncbi:hypothetical protein L484_012612 [Morus notabilis]|uniref:F-box domain-containing protein n=2 Tax=Morus notabilis TaxID=981085 RepID=W9SXW4_9ROSA|nr:hypothetical protein L484_012612 [Morus notabilis]